VNRQPTAFFRLAHCPHSANTFNRIGAKHVCEGTKGHKTRSFEGTKTLAKEKIGQPMSEYRRLVPMASTKIGF
jgi:hypothetical protein